MEIVAPNGTVLIYRMYNPDTGKHIWTGNVEEKYQLFSSGWIYEGTGWFSPIDVGLPVYRMYKRQNGNHHYTMNESERDLLLEIGWQCEGVCWRSADSQIGKPVYRLYYPDAELHEESDIYFFTLSVEERNNLIAAGWRFEGIAWYAFS